MKKKEKQSLFALKVEELTKMLRDSQMALAYGRINRYSRQSSKNVREARVLRTKIAMVLTAMRQKELAHE